VTGKYRIRRMWQLAGHFSLIKPPPFQVGPEQGTISHAVFELEAVWPSGNLKNRAPHRFLLHSKCILKNSNALSVPISSISTRKSSRHAMGKVLWKSSKAASFDSAPK
jgi:hypothetical protein